MRIFTLIILCLVSHTLRAQETKLYHPEADADKDIAAAVSQASKENKCVLIMAGGNWCSWCREFDRFSRADHPIDSLIRKEFVMYHLNYSKENMNEATFAKLGFPQRFGFPVFIILNNKGERIHIQNSEYLEDGKKSYDPKKVFSFLESWTPATQDPATYKN